MALLFCFDFSKRTHSHTFLFLSYLSYIIHTNINRISFQRILWVHVYSPPLTLCLSYMQLIVVYYVHVIRRLWLGNLLADGTFVITQTTNIIILSSVERDIAPAFWLSSALSIEMIIILEIMISFISLWKCAFAMLRINATKVS